MATNIGNTGEQIFYHRARRFHKVDAPAEFDISRNTTTGSTGVSGTDKNMPPYLAVAMWKRTA